MGSSHATCSHVPAAASSSQASPSCPSSDAPPTRHTCKQTAFSCQCHLASCHSVQASVRLRHARHHGLGVWPCGHMNSSQWGRSHAGRQMRGGNCRCGRTLLPPRAVKVAPQRPVGTPEPASLASSLQVKWASAGQGSPREAGLRARQDQPWQSMALWCHQADIDVRQLGRTHCHAVQGSRPSAGTDWAAGGLVERRTCHEAGAALPALAAN